MQREMKTKKNYVLAAAVTLACLGTDISVADESAASGVAIGGTVELEATAEKAYDGTSTSDLRIAKAELGIDASINEDVSGHLVLLFEEDGTPLDVEQAFLTVGEAEKGWSADLGRLGIPFGAFATGLVSDPPTKDLGEAHETALVANFRTGVFTASAYVFNGDSQDGEEDSVEGYGARLALANDDERNGYAVSLDYLSSLADSNGLQDGVANVTTLTDYVPGVAIFASYRHGPFSVIGEYVGANSKFEPSELGFNGSGAQPRAYNVELGIDWTLAGKAAHVGVAYQGTGEALALELPKRRALVALSLELLKNTTLGLEIAREEDYAAGDTAFGAAGVVGGTGESASAYTAKLAVEF